MKAAARRLRAFMFLSDGDSTPTERKQPTGDRASYQIRVKYPFLRKQGEQGKQGRLGEKNHWH